MNLNKDQQGFKIALPTKLAHSVHMMLYGDHHPAILRHEMGMGFDKKGERLPNLVITRGIPLDKATERLLKYPEERA